MGSVDTGLFLGRIPYIKVGSGPLRAVVFFGGNALFRRLNRSDAGRYALKGLFLVYNSLQGGFGDSRACGSGLVDE